MPKLSAAVGDLTILINFIDIKKKVIKTYRCSSVDVDEEFVGGSPVAFHSKSSYQNEPHFSCLVSCVYQKFQEEISPALVEA
jgi:hypothetical protein